jgi:hypothetical protein
MSVFLLELRDRAFQFIGDAMIRLAGNCIRACKFAFPNARRAMTGYRRLLLIGESYKGR